jgi:hypothetical protein
MKAQRVCRRKKEVAQEVPVEKEESWKRGNDVIWKRRAVKVVRALGAFGLDVGGESWRGGKEVAQEVSCRVIKSLITCRLDVGAESRRRGRKVAWEWVVKVVRALGAFGLDMV